MNIILFLYLVGFGWHKYDEEFETYNECEMIKNRFLTKAPDRMEGFCCTLTAKSCLNFNSVGETNYDS